MTDVQDLENELNAAQADEPGTPPDQSGSSGGGSDDSGLTNDFANLATEIAKLRDLAARSQADYKNLTSRTERERGEMADFVTEKLVLKLLPTADRLRLLVEETPEADRVWALYEGVKSTFSGLSKVLESIGVATFDSVGLPLDPAFHEAIAQVPGEEGVVATEFEKGYKLRDRVIRHAKVTVGGGKL